MVAACRAGLCIFWAAVGRLAFGRTVEVIEMVEEVTVLVDPRPATQTAILRYFGISYDY